MNKIVRIPSKLYFELFQKGGDKLLSVYTILKSSREGEIKYYSYKSKNNKTVSGLSLLRSKTSLTLHAIEKYVPLLIEMELCFIDTNGDFILVGGEKLKEKYGNKLVPIKVGKNLLETSYNVISVRLHSAHKKQIKEIEKKSNRSEIIQRGLNPQTQSEYRKGKEMFRRFGEITIIDKTVLSVQGFAKIKDWSEDKKSKGAYWKTKLKDRGVVETKRQFTRLVKMSFAEYKASKPYLSPNQTYYMGWLVEETVSSFLPINLIKENIIIKTDNKLSNYKALSYLQFDMIDFWMNS